MSSDIYYDATYDLVIKNTFNGTTISSCTPCQISTPAYDCNIELNKYMTDPQIPYDHNFRIKSKWGVVDAGYDVYDQSTGTFAGWQERHANADLTLWGVGNGTGIDYNTTYEVEPYVVLNDGRTINNCNATPIILTTPAYDCNFGITTYTSGSVVPYNHSFRIQSQRNTASSGFDVFLKSNYTLIGNAERHANADISLRNVTPSAGSPGIQASTSYYIRPYNITIFGDKVWTCSGDIELVTDASPNYLKTSGAQPDEAALALSVFPNPSHGHYRLEFGAEAYETLQVFNYAGALVRSFSLPIGAASVELDLSDQAEGAYLLKLIGK
ncbi:MAG: T9SS type A sorting domain-containing protein, partial [Bacteroidota bacterium]